MKKEVQTLISRVLMGINALIVIVLLVMSFIVIYFSASEQRQLFGHTALIYKTYDTQNNELHNLYIIDIDETSVSIGTEIMFYTLDTEWENSTTISKIVDLNTSTATMLDGSIVDIASDMYIGKVTKKNLELGEKLHAFTSSQTPLMLYVIFGCGFVILSLVVILVLAVRIKRDALTKAEIPVLFDLDDDDDDDEVSLLVREITKEDSLPPRLKNLQSPKVLDQIFFTDRDDLSAVAAQSDSAMHSGTEADPVSNSDIDKILNEIISHAEHDFYSKLK